MKKKFFETTEFQKLQKEWDKKLKASGFTDIQSESEKTGDYITKQVIKVNKSFVAYNQQCLAYLHSGKIEDKTDLFIFESHCNGLSSYEITDLLPMKGFKPLDRRTVDRRILRILKDANITPQFRFTV